MSSALIGCIVLLRWDPMLNPYRYEQAVVLFGLLIAVLAWRRTRPSPSRIVRWYLGVGAVVTLAVTCEQTCIGVRPSEVSMTSMLILQVSTALMVCMYVEIFRRHRNVPHEGGHCSARARA